MRFLFPSRTRMLVASMLMMIAAQPVAAFVTPRTVVGTGQVHPTRTHLPTSSANKVIARCDGSTQLHLVRVGLTVARPALTRFAALFLASFSVSAAHKLLVRDSIRVDETETRGCPLFTIGSNTNTTQAADHGFSGGPRFLQLTDIRLWLLKAMGRRPVVSIADTDLTTQVNKLEFVQTLALPDRDNGLLATTDGNRHAYLRRLLEQAFTPQALHAAVPRLQQVTMCALQQSILTPTVVFPRFASINIYDVSLDCILDTILCQYLGLSLTQEELPVMREVLKAYTTTTAHDVASNNNNNNNKKRRYRFPWQKQKKTNRLASPQQTRARVYLRSIILAQMTNLKRRPDSSVLSQLIWAKETTDFGVQTLTDQEILDSMLCLIVAGTQSTAEVLATALELLGRHPKQYHRLVQEQRDYLLLKDTNGGQQQQQQELNYDLLDKEHAPFLDTVVNEALRLHPANTSPRLVTEDVQFQNGQRVPKGWFVKVESSSSNNPQPTWDQDGKEEEETDDEERASATFAPFGEGPRACLGQSLAVLQLKVFLASLARCVDSFGVVADERTTRYYGDLRMDQVEISSKATTLMSGLAAAAIDWQQQQQDEEKKDYYTTTATAGWMRDALDASPSSFA